MDEESDAWDALTGY